MTEYISCADTAKLIRAALKRNWPNVKFSVRSRTYSMGASIDVSWTDGPAAPLVNKVVEPYAGASFDAMQDLKESRYAVLYANGTLGSNKPNPCGLPLPPGARLVRFGADFVFTHRRLSIELASRAVASAKRRWAKADDLAVVADNAGAYFTGQAFDNSNIRQHVVNFMSVAGA